MDDFQVKENKKNTQVSGPILCPVHGNRLEIAKSFFQVDYVAGVYRPLRCLASHKGQHTVLLSALCAFRPFAMLSASTAILYLVENKSLFHAYSSHYFRETCILGHCMIVIKSLNVSHCAIRPPTHVRKLAGDWRGMSDRRPPRISSPGGISKLHAFTTALDYDNENHRRLRAKL